MARKSTQSENWNFPVESMPLKNPKTGQQLDGWHGLFRTDTGEMLGTGSKNYQIVQNHELITVARAAMEKKGFKDWEERIVVAGTAGEQLFAQFTVKEDRLKTKVGDKFGYQVVFKNSFDGSLPASIAMGFLRLACLNGACSLEKEFSLAQKHTSTLNLDRVSDVLSEAVDKSKSALEVFDVLAGIPCAEMEGINALQNLTTEGIISDNLRQNMVPFWLSPRRKEDKARNLHTLYCAASEYLTHVTSKERYVYAAKINWAVCRALYDAAVDKSKGLLKSLFAAPKVKGVVVSEVIDAEIVGTGAPLALPAPK